MKFNEQNISINGTLSINSINTEDGTIIDNIDECNVVTAQGASELLSRLTRNDSTVTDSFIQTIALGNEVGTGDLLGPEPADESYTASKQDLIYTVPPEDISITYPDPFTFEISTVLNGTSIIESTFPQDIEMRFTSATIRYANSKALAFKRFPVRSLSRLVDIEIRWTVSLKSSE